MSETRLSPEQKGRYAAYSGRDGVVYHHHTEQFDVGTTNVWHYLKDVREVRFRPAEGKVAGAQVDSSDIAALEARATELKEAASYVRRITKLKESWAPSSEGLLSTLLERAASLRPLPKNSGVYALMADETTDDLSWGSGAWRVGMIGARKARDSLTLDIQFIDALTQDEDTRRQAYGFAAGAVAMQCIPYDRGNKHPLRSVFVRPAPNMKHPFTKFDYVLEMLQGDQSVDIAALSGASNTAMQAGLAAVRTVHSEELAQLGGGGGA